MISYCTSFLLEQVEDIVGVESNNFGEMNHSFPPSMHILRHSSPQVLSVHSFVTCIRIVSSSPFRLVSSRFVSPRLSERIESLNRESTIRRVRLRDYAREKRRLPW